MSFKPGGGDPNMLTKIRNRQKGFTLIELLIVVAIIGIIAAL
jgi:prepilin-type N-terminal cleavage/methylation domain-containing protein